MLLALVVTAITAVVILCLLYRKTRLIGLALWILLLFIQPGIFAIVIFVTVIILLFRHWMMPKLIPASRRLPYEQ